MPPSQNLVSAPLLIDGLSVLGDKPPQPPVLQPAVENGIHLRWSPGSLKGFPVKSGYYLFRRRTDGPVCLLPKLKSRSPAELQTMALVATDIGTLSTSDSQPFGVLQSGGAVEGILFADPKALRFALPVGVLARSVSIRVRFLGNSPAMLQTGFQLGIDPPDTPAPVNKSGVSYEPIASNGQPDAVANIVPGVEDPNSSALMCWVRVDVMLPTPSVSCRVVLGKGGAKVEVFEADGTLAMSLQYAPDEWGMKEFFGKQLQKVVVTGKAVRVYGVHYLLPLDVINVSVLGFRQNTVVIRQIVSGTWRQEATAVFESPVDLDSIQISGGPAALLDLCYTPQSSGNGTAIPNPPGRSWEAVPKFTYPLTLPIVHPAYPASPGQESIDKSVAIAKTRLRYGLWEDSFKAVPRLPGIGTASFSPGSAIVTGTGTRWTSGLAGSLICLPGTGTDFAAYIIMWVATANRLVLSRPFSGDNQANGAYQLIEKADAANAASDDFAELHDQLACLFQSPGDMGSVIAPPVSDQGTVASGKFVRAFAGSPTVQGFGTNWSHLLEGMQIEIGPRWFGLPFPRCVEEKSVFRVVSVNPTNQTMTLDGLFPGAGFCQADFRVLARSSNDTVPTLELSPMQMIELASLSPSYAQVLGLYWTDTTAEGNAVYDYAVLADFNDRFAKQATNALNWLNGSDFSDASVDVAAIFEIKHAGSSPVPPPIGSKLFHLPGAGGRMSLLRFNVADSDVGISVTKASAWTMVNTWRIFRGIDAEIADALSKYQKLDYGQFVPQDDVPADQRPPLPPDWPADTLHFVDSRLDVGWYGYRLNSIDLFGRYSELSDALVWTNKPSNEASVFAVHLADRTPPPPPVAVQAWALDDRDPYVRRDAAFDKWRSQFLGAGKPVVGLRVQWRWPWTHRNQGADLKEFRVYFQSKPLNARLGTVVSVSPVNGHPDQSLATLDLTQKDSPPDSYKLASLQVGNRSFPIIGSQTGVNVTLIAQNGGPSHNEAPDATGPATIVIPVPRDPNDIPHPLYKELLNPLNWELWLTVVAVKAARVPDEVELLEDPNIKTFDHVDNLFTGTAGLWQSGALTLDVPSTQSLATVRPGIDVIALVSIAPPGYFVLEIASVPAGGKTVVPTNPKGLSAGTPYQWRIGPRTAGLQGLAAQWFAATNTLVLNGTGDASLVRPGVDLVYLPVDSAASPSNLNYFFQVAAVDAGSRTITLALLATQLALLNGKTNVPWKIGRPQRVYDVFLPPNPAAAKQEPYLTLFGDPLDIAKIPLWKASASQPVAYGTVSVSGADKRTEVPDQRPGRSRTGNEGSLAGPATVFLVNRDPPPKPDSYLWPGGRLYATRANYHGKSYFTMRWMKPVKDGDAYSINVHRAMDSSLALVHKASLVDGNKNFPAAPNGASKALTAVFGAHQMDDIGALYTALPDSDLAFLAAHPFWEAAYSQINLRPVSLPELADRIGPNDAASYVPDQVKFCAYVDSLDGKSRNRYFYRVQLLDGAQNAGPLGDPTPPVYLPRVVPPKTPVIHKVNGGNRTATITWARDPDRELVGYRVYRSDEGGAAKDVRSMKLIATVNLGGTWTDPGEGLNAGIKYYYRLTAIDQLGNESPPTPAYSATIFDRERPAVPVWLAPSWMHYREEGQVALPSGGVPLPQGYEWAVQLCWSCASANAKFSVYRQFGSDGEWIKLPTSRITSKAGQPNTFYLLDRDGRLTPIPSQEVYYRIVARSTANIVALQSPEIKL